MMESGNLKPAREEPQLWSDLRHVKKGDMAVKPQKTIYKS